MEFQEVMKQINRICANYANCSDSGCPLFGECGNIGSYASNPKQTVRIEETVMAWAAEHPEPEYPTWWKYLCMIGVIPDELGDKTLGEMTVYSLMNTHIQSDIAEKLEIEPKEG